MGPHERFRNWVSWLGVSDVAVARRLGCDESYPGKVLRGERRPGIDVAAAIERVTARPREDGEVWPEGPIRATEWAAHPTSVEQGSTCEESGS